MDAEYERIKSTQAILEKESGHKAAQDSFRAIAEDAFENKVLSKEMVTALIDRICVYPDGRVDITWMTPSIDTISAIATA